MKAKICLFLLMLLVGLQTALSQNMKVAGTVLDENGDPIVGASVLVKGTDKGQITDLDGKFQFGGLKLSDVLIISYVGMRRQEITVKSNLVVTLQQDAELLDEVIVTAFGTAKKSSFTGSATVLKSEKIEQKQVTNVMSALIGEVPGLQIAPTTSPGSTSSILIRGEGSINAGTDPLIVLDGIPYDGSWNNINPQDVESVSVLKDAASNALYGSRGANGVIIVTTKKGQAGKAKVTVDAKWGVNQRSTSDYDRIDNPGEYYETYYKAYYNSYIYAGKSTSEAHKYANETLFKAPASGGLGYNVYTIPEGEYLIGTNGKLNPNATLGRRVYMNGEVYTLYPDDWTEETYQNGLRQEYNVSISGGNGPSQIYGSFGYLNDEGIVAASGFERYSTRLRASYQAKSWLLFGANVSYAYAEYDRTSGSSGYTSSDVFTQAANVAPIYPLYARDRDGNILYDSNGKVYDWGNSVYNPYNRVVAANTCALNEISIDKNYRKSHSLTGDAFVDVSFLKDFKFTFKSGTSVRSYKTTNTYNPYYGYYVSAGGYIYKEQEDYTTINLQQLLNWNHKYGKHNVSAMIGHEYYKENYETLSGDRNGAVNYEGNHELNGYLNATATPASSYKTFYNTEGYLFRAMYDYDDRYYGSFSFRRDASSRFHPDNRWGNFWSAGAAWIISKENWFNVEWVNNLKFKISYGEQGNDAIGSYRYVDTYSINNVNNEVALSFSVKGNKDISWETNKNFNTGIEFDLFRNRLGGSIEYYNRMTGDMLLQFSTPSTLGYTYYWKNVGDLRNQGVEITLSGSPIRTKHIDWSLNANVTYNKQKVTYLPEENNTVPTDGYRGYISGSWGYVGEGLSLNTWYMPKYAGVSEEGLSQWYCKTSTGEQGVTTDYNKATSYVIPIKDPVYGGFGTSLKVYDFDISAQFTYSIGGKGYDYEYSSLMTVPVANSTGLSLHRDILDAWSLENTGSNIPRWSFGDEYTGYMSDRFLTDNTYVAFQNFQVGYTLPKQLCKKFGIEKVRVYVVGDNLCLWSKRKGYDPRISSGYGTYSPMRTISGGINLQF